MSIKMCQIKDFKQIENAFKDRNIETCSVGSPTGDGIRLGYEGWGNPDIYLDPALPLDMCIDRLDLKNRFKSVVSINFLNCVHGDCFLTHAANGLKKLLCKNGVLKIHVLNTAALAKDAIEKLEKSTSKHCQMLEKFCFLPAFDTSGLVYQQTFLNPKRIQSLFNLKLLSEKINIDHYSMSPDEIRLENITDEKWQKADLCALTESLDYNRPSCIVCNKLSTKTDGNRSIYSRYCKDHYHQARIICDKSIRNAYTMIFKYQNIN